MRRQCRWAARRRWTTSSPRTRSWKQDRPAEPGGAACVCSFALSCAIALLPQPLGLRLQTNVPPRTSASSISGAAHLNPSAADGTPPPAGRAWAPSTSVGPWFTDVSADGPADGAGVGVDVAAAAVGFGVGEGMSVGAGDGGGVGSAGRVGVGAGVSCVEVAVGVGVLCPQSTSLPVKPPDS